MISKECIWQDKPKAFVIEFADYTSYEELEKELVGYRVVEKVGRVYIVEEIDKF